MANIVSIYSHSEKNRDWPAYHKPATIMETVPIIGDEFEVNTKDKTIRMTVIRRKYDITMGVWRVFCETNLCLNE